MVMAMVIVVLVVVVAIIMIFMIPVAFVDLPALLIVIVVRMIPIGAFIRRLLPTSRNPFIVAAIRSPVAFDPAVTRARSFRPSLVTKRRRRTSDI
jgi:hypothetical protein